MSGDIRAFIEARYAEREQAAKAAGGARWVWRTDSESEIIAPITAGGGLAVRMDAGNILMREHVIANDPRYVLDDLAVKRAILDQHAGANGLCGRCVERWDYHHDGCEECVDEPHETPVMYVGRPCPTVLLLAQPFRLHPEFDPTWRMEP